jgi:hypothetical protein
MYAVKQQFVIDDVADGARGRDWHLMGLERSALDKIFLRG